MHWKQLMARLNGVSTPIFGVSWTPATADRDVAVRVLTDLEGRRMLYQGRWRHGPGDFQHVVASVLEVRRFLTEIIGNGGIAPELEKPLRKMRRACIDFLDVASATERPDGSRRGMHDTPVAGYSRQLSKALDDLRNIFGLQISLLSLRYGVDVEEPLASMLPEQITHD